MTLQSFLEQFFLFALKNGIAVAFARPYHIKDNFNDLDLLIQERDIQNCIAWIRAQQDLIVTSDYRRNDGRTIIIYGFMGEKRVLQVDFISSLSLKGLAYADLDAVLLRADENKQLDPVDQSLILLMTHGIKHGKLSAEYNRYIQETLIRSSDSFIASCILNFSEQRSLDIYEQLRDGSFVGSVNYLHNFIWKKLSLAPFDAIRNLVFYYFKEAYLRFSLPVSIIAFYGVDGAGKTHLINLVKKDLAGTVKAIRHGHFLPILPNETEPDSNITIKNPHDLPDRDAVTSILKASYYFCYCWLCYLWPQRGSVLFLMDRFFPDMMVDPKRLRYGGPQGFVKFLYKFLPPVQLSIFVSTDPALAYQRKPELPLNEVMRQDRVYQELIKNLPFPLIVKGDAPSYTNAELITRHIIAILGVQNG